MAGLMDGDELYPGGLLTPGPTRYAAAEARKLRGSQGLLLLNILEKNGQPVGLMGR